MVAWLGDDDPEVRVHQSRMEDEVGAEQATDAIELVAFQKSLCHL